MTSPRKSEQRQDDEGVGHERELTGFTTYHERRILLWMSARLPERITPDHLTALGFLGALMTGAGFALSYRGNAWLLFSALGLIVNWLGDSLDGTVARYRKIERPRYGFFVDQMVDIAGQIAIMLGLGLSPYARFEVACLTLAVYMLVTVYTLMKLHISKTKQLTYYGVGPTEVRLCLLAGIALAAWLGPDRVRNWLGPLGLFDILCLGFVAAAVAVLIWLVRRDARELYLNEISSSDQPDAR